MSALLSVVLTFFILPATFAQDPAIEFSDGTVRTYNLNKEVLYFFIRYNRDQEDWQDVFPVRTKGATVNVAGTYTVGETDVTFTPRFPWAGGVEYESSFDLAQLAKNHNEIYVPASPSNVLHLQFSLTPSARIAPAVVTVYPTGNMLPENNLKFHVVFNTPMTQGDVYRFVKLYDRDGMEIEKAFLIVDQEFWDQEMKVVTLLLDPGRIKRGLKANLQLGAPLVARNNYRLVVHSGWKNIDGVKTGSVYSKEFTCMEADRKPVNVAEWKIVTPSLASGDLIIECHESLNFIQSQDAIRIVDAQNNKIEGDVVLHENESVIIFRPKERWKNGTYTLMVNPLLEDLAGNNLKRLFDEDMQAVRSDKPTVTTRIFAVNILRD